MVGPTSLTLLLMVSCEEGKVGYDKCMRYKCGVVADESLIDG